MVPTSTAPCAEIIPVGNELLRGDAVDTNSKEIQARLAEAGVRTVRSTVVGDDAGAIADAVGSAAERSHVVVVTGGLGPTEDDITREGLAAAAGVELEMRPDALESIKAFFERIGRPMPAGNRCQAMAPAGSRVIANPVGTAPGFEMKLGKSLIFCLPGVPVEMRAMIEAGVLPAVRGAFPGAPSMARRTLRMIGVPESSANDRIRDLMRSGDPLLGMTAHDMVITITIASFAADGRAKVDGAAEKILAEFGDRIFAEGRDATLAGRVIEMLRERTLTVATAESCTGGLIGYHLTSVPGASDVFREGYVTYTGEAKSRLLGVPPGLIAAQGEVSAAVACAMASGAAEKSGCSASIAVTGIAGPGGGTAEKPVGLVHMAATVAGRTEHKELRFGGGRDAVRRRTAMCALDLLRRMLLDRALKD